MNINHLMQITQEGELWEQVPNYPKYYVSSEGRIYSEYEQNIINGSWTQKGYHVFEFYNDETPKGKHGKRLRLSHIVAAAFIKGYNPKKHKHVHHVNRNRGDDRLINLLPCTTEQHQAIHDLYKYLANNIELLLQLLNPIIEEIRASLEVQYSVKGGDAA